MKINCNLVKDILPLYVKEETSTESNTIIKEHLEECEDCRKLHQMLLHDDSAVQSLTKDKGFGKSLKKVKSRLIIRSAIATLLAVLILCGMFVFMFWGIVPVKSSNVEIVPEVTIKNDSDFDYYDVTFHLTLKKPGRCIDLRYGFFCDPDEFKFGYNEANVYSQIKLPFDDRGKNPESYDAGMQFAELTGKEKMVFRFRDKDVVYNIKDLIENAGLLK